jgi:hypothetical protein
MEQYSYMSKNNRLRDFSFDVFDLGANIAYTFRLPKIGDHLRKVAVRIMLGKQTKNNRTHFY